MKFSKQKQIQEVYTVEQTFANKMIRFDFMRDDFDPNSRSEDDLNY